MSGLTIAEWSALASRRTHLVRLLAARFPELDAEDVAQEALLHAWRFRDTYRPIPGATAWSWLKLIARQRAYDEFRKRRRGTEQLTDDYGHAYSAEAALDARRKLASIKDVDAFIATVERRKRDNGAGGRVAFTIPDAIVDRAADLVRQGMKIYRVVQALGPTGRNGKNVSRSGLRAALRKRHPDLSWCTAGGRPARLAA